MNWNFINTKDNESILIIDPPEGWKYGFPRPFTKKQNQTVDEWLEEVGYPTVLIKQGMSKYCRYWTMR